MSVRFENSASRSARHAGCLNALETHGGAIIPVVRYHNGPRLVAELEPDSNWRCSSTIVAVEPGLYDLSVHFELLEGSVAEVATAVVFEFDHWLADDYLLMPSAVYRGNAFEVLDTPYPPVWRDKSQFRTDMPVTITPSPRFAEDSPRLEQTTGDAASPCMGFFSPRRGFGFLVQTTQGSRFGNHGFTFERKEEGVRLIVSAPCVREFRQDHCKAVASDDRAVDWEKGDQLTMFLRVSIFEGHRLQSLFDHYAGIRKALNPSSPCHVIPFSAAWKIVEEKFNLSNWVEHHGYYKLAPNFHTTFEVAEDPLCFLWQLGWVGGGMMTLPMLGQGSETTRQRAWRNLEMIFDKTRGPSGFFRTIGDGEKFYTDGFDRPLPHRMQLIRKSGDWLFHALKQFDLLVKQGSQIPPAWYKAIRDLADAFVRLYDEYGQFGQFIDGDTGELLIGGSAAGAIIPAALARAASWYEEPRFLEVALVSAKDYYTAHVLTGVATGGPGEILSAPDSESAFALVESFVTLSELSDDPLFIQASREAVSQASTWVVSYDHQFPAGSLLAKNGTRSTGAVFANTQNKHASPAICTSSGDALFRFWRATGDPLALDLICDIAHGIPQYLSRADRPLGDAMHPGWMCERVNLSDWEGAEGVGNNLFGSCSWTETALMLTTWEIPGIYLQPDTGRLIVFDHLDVSVLRYDDSGIMIEIQNPTAFDAETRVLCELSSATRTPLPLNALFDAPVLIIPAGAKITHLFSNHD